MNKDGKYSFDYYIAGTDSCAGDSGGPVYRWINGVPTLVAIVARSMKQIKKWLITWLKLNFSNPYIFSISCLRA